MNIYMEQKILTAEDLHWNVLSRNVFFTFMITLYMCVCVCVYVCVCVCVKYIYMCVCVWNIYICKIYIYICIYVYKELCENMMKFFFDFIFGQTASCKWLYNVYIFDIYAYIYNSLVQSSFIFIWLMLWWQRNLLIYYTILSLQVQLIRG